MARSSTNLLPVARATTLFWTLLLPPSFNASLNEKREGEKVPLFPVLSHYRLFFRQSYISNISLRKRKCPGLHDPVSTLLPKENEIAENQSTQFSFRTFHMSKCMHIKYFFPNHINSVTLSLGLWNPGPETIFLCQFHKYINALKQSNTETWRPVSF